MYLESLDHIKSWALEAKKNRLRPPHRRSMNWIGSDKQQINDEKLYQKLFWNNNAEKYKRAKGKVESELIKNQEYKEKPEDQKLTRS